MYAFKKNYVKDLQSWFCRYWLTFSYYWINNIKNVFFFFLITCRADWLSLMAGLKWIDFTVYCNGDIHVVEGFAQNVGHIKHSISCLFYFYLFYYFLLFDLIWFHVIS